MHEKLDAILNHPFTIPAAIGVTSFASGLGLGFFLGKRKYMQAEIHVFPKPEVDFDVDYEEKVNPEKDRPPKVIIDPEVALEKGIVTVTDLADLRSSMVSQNEENDEDIEVDIQNVETEDKIVQELIDSEMDWDWEEELASRTESAPYILHEDEYVENEKNYTQTALTYYTEDEVLADEDGAPIYDMSTVGELKFGHGCRDKDTFFVRNDERRAEYEIGRIEGFYAMEVLGYEIEKKAEKSDLKHSKHMRFRME